jgi:hypothetical protein
MPKIRKQSFGKLSRAIVALHLTLFLFSVVYADPGLNLKHNVDKNVSRNTYVNGQEVIVKFEYLPALESNVTYHWQSYKGEKITQPVLLDAGKEAVIVVPGGELPHYLGLVFTPVNDAISLPGREPGEQKEYGFAIFPNEPQASSAPDPNRWMGMVHADLEDPWLSGWVKTLTWKTTSAKWWHSKIEKRRVAGSVELPIISGAEWKSDDYEPVKPTQLAQLEKRAREYFAADPGTIYWETGIEENLGGRFKRPYYLTNLAAKSDAVRAAADDANPDIKLIFQIANIRYRDVGVFMRSAAAKNYDILSLHPYNWPDFPPPEEWLTNYLDRARSEMKQSGRVLPIWVTEIGAPHRGNCPDCFFGYPKDNKSVPGLSDQEMIAYLIKFQVIAVHDGVEKVFWYNYKDRGPDREFAEDHFGLIDYWGYPKPAYLAYVHMNRSLVDKTVGEAVRKKDIWAYEFCGDSEDVIVAWSFPADSAVASLADLGIRSSSDSEISVTNAIGDSVAVEDGLINLTNEPVFVRVGSKQQSE